VILEATDDLGVPDTDSTLALIGLPPQSPVANAGSPYTGAVGVAVNFNGSASSDPDGTITQYDWDYDDGSPIDIDAGPTPSHIYAASGVYNPTLTVTDNDSTTDTDTTLALIGVGNQAPLAEAGGPYPGLINTPIIFDGSGSVDPDGGSLVYVWDFGDGSPLGSGVKPTHTYTTAGVRNVTLTVTDDAGTPASDSAAALIGSGTRLPVAVAGGPYNGEVNGPVTFDGTVSFDPDGGNIVYAWDFGDGTIGSGAIKEHTYSAKGLYTVTLTVRDDSGATASESTEADIGGGGGGGGSNLCFINSLLY